MGWNVTDPPSPRGWPVSSIVGSAPACEQDFYVIYWQLCSFSKGKNIPPRTDPALGFPKMYGPMLNNTAGLPHDSKGDKITAIGASVGVFITLIVGLRLGLRFFVKRLVWGWDDWLMIPALLACLGLIFKSIALVEHAGLGKHKYDVTYKEFSGYFSIGESAGYVLLFLASALIKLSLSVSLYRLVYSRSKGWERYAQGLSIALAIWTVCAAFIPWFAEGDPRWKTDIVWAGRQAYLGRYTFRYINMEKYNIAMSVIHVTFDFILFFSAMVIFWKLRVGIGKKLRVVLLFSAGLATCLCSVFRMIANDSGSGDLFYISAYGIVKWAIADVGSAIIVANLPVLSVLFPKSSKSSSGSSSNQEWPKDLHSPLRQDSIETQTRDGSFRKFDEEFQWPPLTATSEESVRINHLAQFQFGSATSLMKDVMRVKGENVTVAEK